MASTVTTTIQNTASFRRKVPYIPPNGKWMNAGETVVIPGILETELVLGSDGGLEFFRRDLAAGRVATSYQVPGVTSTGGLSKSEVDVPALVTVSDGDQAMAPGLSTTPSAGGNLIVVVSGVLFNVGNGDKTRDCYFSDDGGATAKSIVDIVAGDTLHWVGSVAGTQLDTDDRVSVYYVV